MNDFLISSMGRIAGATAADTRERLLRAAADVFARRGYDGTRVADIAAAAGVSNGALYAHFGSKAELLVAALRAHGKRHLADMLSADPGRPVTEVLLAAGRALAAPCPDTRGSLIVEALVAARRDPEVARLMRDYCQERTSGLADLVRGAQGSGELDSGLSAAAIAHFCMLLSMGSALLTPDRRDLDDQDWAALLTRLAGALAPAGPGPAAPASPARASTGSLAGGTP
jgi:AcrR family transcriptional regulator